MIPVLQTLYGPAGNCFEACVASILELPLESVPILGTWSDLREWLGWRGWSLRFGEREGWAILSHRIFNGSIHAVVCFDGEVVHDPSPRPFEIGEPVIWTQIRRVA